MDITKRMIQSKKGIFFTLSGVFLLAFLLVFLNVQYVNSPIESAGSTNRLVVIDEFIDSIYTDATFALQTASFRGFLAMNDYISTNGVYIDDTELRLLEAITNETVNNESFFVIENNSISYWKANMIDFASDFNLEVNITFGEFSLAQTDPWYVDVTYEINLSVYDEFTTANWNESREVLTQVPIEGIYDPIYIINTGNAFTIYFEQSPYETFVIGTNITNLTEHITGQYYVQFDGAPSFLNRFEGNSASSGSTGIESLIDKDEMSTEVAVDTSLSNVDYIYFFSIPHTSYNFSILPSDFHLDNHTGAGIGHLDHYNVTHLIS